MFCTKCGNELSENEAFCPTCGTPTAAASEGAPMPETTPNPFAAAPTPAPEATSDNPFAANSTSTVDPTNPFATQVEAAPEKKKNKPIVLVAAILVAILVLAGLGYAYEGIIIPKRDRENVLAYTATCMDTICSGESGEEDFYYMTGLGLSDSDIEEVEDALMVEFENMLGVPASDEVRSSVDTMLRALLDRMVESYDVDEDSYTRDGDVMTVDVNVTGIDVVSLQAALQEEDLEDMLYDYLYDNLDRYMAMESEDEIQTAIANDILPIVFDTYTQRINEAESTTSVWTFTCEKKDGELYVTELDTHGTLSEDVLTDLF